MLLPRIRKQGRPRSRSVPAEMRINLHENLKMQSVARRDDVSCFVHFVLDVTMYYNEKSSDFKKFISQQQNEISNNINFYTQHLMTCHSIWVIYCGFLYGSESSV